MQEMYLQMKVPFIANIWGLWHLQGTEYISMWEQIHTGLQSNRENLISFSQREFLSQKGQSLAADTNGKQYMGSMYDRLSSAHRTDSP